MKGSLGASRRMVAIVLVFALATGAASPASAQAPVKMKNFTGSVDVSATGPTPVVLEGTASHLGRFTARGEVEFTPTGVLGMLRGIGVIVFEAANGDLLVGTVTWDVGSEVRGERTADLHFRWQDDVTFADGTTVANTGRFVTSRPPGLVVIAIIAVLIALLVPAVQKTP
jgi:hypothetical protein